MAWIMESLRGEVSDKTVTTIGTCPGLEMLGRGGKGEERKARREREKSLKISTERPQVGGL